MNYLKLCLSLSIFFFSTHLSFAISPNEKIQEQESLLKEYVSAVDVQQIDLLLQQQMELESSSDEAQLVIAILEHNKALRLLQTGQHNKGFSKKAYTLLSKLGNSTSLKTELKPFVQSYQAASLALVAVDKQDRNMLNQALNLMDQMVVLYGKSSYLPYFLRAELNLRLGKEAKGKRDLQKMLKLLNRDQDRMSALLQSWMYYSLAKVGKQEAATYDFFLQKAIILDEDNLWVKAQATQLLQESQDPFKVLND